MEEVAGGSQEGKGMTLPYERYSAVLRTKEFLFGLLDPSKTPRVPLAVRQEARSLLKHFPAEWEMEATARKVPQYFSKDMK
jgi:hypothetical protein